MLLAAPMVAADVTPAPVPALTTTKDRSRGFDDTPYFPGSPWRVHDIARPAPPDVDPGTPSIQDTPGKPPSDALVLFDGRSTAAWTKAGPPVDPPMPVGWTVNQGVLEVVPKSGNIITRQGFGSCQLHMEWQVPEGVQGTGQRRANSGVYLMGRYEVQILDPFTNPTYADGAAGGIYGQYPPLVMPGRPPGSWQSYDIIFHAPRFSADKTLVKPAYMTVLFNGILVVDHAEILGRMTHAKLPTYEYHGDREPLMLQEKGHILRFRNIWIRELAEAETK